MEHHYYLDLVFRHSASLTFGMVNDRINMEYELRDEVHDAGGDGVYSRFGFLHIV